MEQTYGVKFIRVLVLCGTLGFNMWVWLLQINELLVKFTIDTKRFNIFVINPAACSTFMKHSRHCGTDDTYVAVISASITALTRKADDDFKSWSNEQRWPSYTSSAGFPIWNVWTCCMGAKKLPRKFGENYRKSIEEELELKVEWAKDKSLSEQLP